MPDIALRTTQTFTRLLPGASVALTWIAVAAAPLLSSDVVDDPRDPGDPTPKRMQANSVDQGRPVGFGSMFDAFGSAGQNVLSVKLTYWLPFD